MYTVIGPDGREAAPVDLQTLQGWVTRGQLPAGAIVIRPDGTRSEAGQIPELMPYFPSRPSSSALDGLIPTGNPKALTAYYISLLSLVPCLGLIPAPVAMVYASKGLKAFNQTPHIRGKGHAITAFVISGFGIALNLTGIIVFVSSLPKT